MSTPTDPTASPLPPEPPASSAEPAAPGDPGAIHIQALPSAPTVTTVVSAPAPPPPERRPWTAEQVAALPAFLDRAIVVVVLVLAFFLASFAARNADLWMHLASGRLIAQSQFDFGHDPFTYTAESERWVNHTWLSDLLGYTFFQAFGGTDSALAGGFLVIAKAALITALAGILLLIRRAGTSVWLPALCVALALFTMSPRLFLQPTCISFFFLGLTLLILHRSVRRLPALGEGDTPNQDGAPSSGRMLWLLPIIFVLWVNMDDWYLLGPVTLGLFLAGLMIQRAVAPSTQSDGGTSLVGRLAVIFVAGLVACLVSPYHVYGLTLPPELWALIWGKSLQGDPYLNAYLLGALNRIYFRNPEMWPFYGLVLLGLASFYLAWPRVPWWRVTVWGGFFLLCLGLQRAIPFFAIVAAPITALNIHAFVLHSEGRLRNGLIAGRIATLIGGVMLLMMAWPGWLAPGSEVPRRTRRVAWVLDPDPSWRKTAEALCDLRQHGVLRPESHGFNFLPEITYYCAWFCPEEKGFFDLRFPLFPEATEEFLRLRRQFTPGQETPENPDTEELNWEERFRANGIDHVILSSNRDLTLLSKLAFEFGQLQQTVIGPLPNSLMGLMLRFQREPAHWTLLYLDGQSAVYGWNDAGPERATAFQSARFSLKHLAFGSHLPESQQARPQLPDPPAPGNIWDRFVKGPAPWPLDAEEAAVQLKIFDERAVDWARAQARTIRALRLFMPFAAPAAAANLGSGSLQHAAAFAALLRVNPQILGISHDIGPSAPLLLGVRAARRAIQASSEDPSSYQLLAQAYKRLNRQEGEWSEGRASFLQQLRQIQVVTALHSAMTLWPDSPVIHFALAETYQQMHYVDLELEQWQATLDAIRATNQRRGSAEETGADRKEAAEQLSSMEKGLEKMIEQREEQTDLKALRNKYEIDAAKASPVERGVLASRRGLIREAIDVLYHASPEEMGTQGADLLVQLLMTTGRGDEILKAGFPLTNRYRLMLAIGSGDYETGDQYAADLGRELQELSIGKLLLLVRYQAFQPGLQPQALGEMIGAIGAVVDQADLIAFRGLLALENGETDRATQFFQESLDLVKAARVESSSTALSATSRPQRVPEASTAPIITRYLQALKDAGCRVEPTDVSSKKK